MNGIEVVIKFERLVVDSRLIAQRLDIQHKNFLVNIEQYEEEAVVEGFLPLAFETRLVKRPQGGSYEERWAWLDEEWANYAMTLSRNTPEVRAAKRGLIKAFSTAKQKLAQKQPQVELLVQQPEPLNADIEQLADEVVKIIFEMIWKSADCITNVKVKTAREQKKLKKEFEKGIDRNFLFSIATEAIGDVGHNAEHQHKEVIKQIRLRVAPYKEYFVSKLLEWQELQALSQPTQPLLPPTVVVLRPKDVRKKIEEFLDRLQSMTPEEQRALFLTVPNLTQKEKSSGRFSSRIIARYLELAPGQDRLVAAIMSERN